MKKFSKIGKRVLAFFLVALMNINAYATSASNDGSQFVTKAEFDSLINNYNLEMNAYLSGLNAKIDNAISGYLGKMSSQSTATIIPYFIQNAGQDSEITCHANDNFPIVKFISTYTGSVDYAATLVTGNANGEIFSKAASWSFSGTGNKAGKRILVTKTDDDRYMYAGYAEKYGETVNVSYARTIANSDDGFTEGTKYLYPLMFNSPQDSIFNNSGSAWKTGFVTFYQTGTGTGSGKQGTNTTGTIDIDDGYEIKREYDIVFSDNDKNTVKIYRFIKDNTSKMVASSITSEKNSTVYDNTSKVSASAEYMNGYNGRSYYKTESTNMSKSSTFSSYSVKNLYFPVTAPVEIGDGCKWSDILYNDAKKYTYKYQSSATAAEVDKTLDGYNMVNGLPLIDVIANQKVTWTYAFTNENDGRRLYIKHGEFDGTNVSGDDIETFDASKKTGSIELTTKRADMLFVKWTAGNTLDCENCSKVSKVAK